MCDLLYFFTVVTVGYGRYSVSPYGIADNAYKTRKHRTM